MYQEFIDIYNKKVDPNTSFSLKTATATYYKVCQAAPYLQHFKYIVNASYTP